MVKFKKPKLANTDLSPTAVKTAQQRLIEASDRADNYIEDLAKKVNEKMPLNEVLDVHKDLLHDENPEIRVKAVKLMYGLMSKMMDWQVTMARVAVERERLVLLTSQEKKEMKTTNNIEKLLQNINIIMNKNDKPANIQSDSSLGKDKSSRGGTTGHTEVVEGHKITGQKDYK